MKPSASPSASHPHGRPRRHLARLLQSSLLRLDTLADHALLLRARIADSPAYAALCDRVDLLLRELQLANRLLATRALALGAQLRNRASAHRAMLHQVWKKASALPADLVASLAQDCRTCGTRLCSLLQAAQTASDPSCARVAYSVLRTLEKQLWLLSPHSEGSAHPFVLATRTA